MNALVTGRSCQRRKENIICTNGLRLKKKTKKKRRSIFNYLKDQKMTFFTFCKKRTRNGNGEEKFFTRMAQTVLLLNILAVTDSEGRIILANISINSVQLSLCNICAPNNNLQIQHFCRRFKSVFTL